MLTDTLQDSVVRDTVAVSGHHFGGWTVAIVVVVVALAVGFLLWRSTRPVVVNNSRK